MMSHYFGVRLRYFALLEAREANGGRPIPEIWQRWKREQKEIGR